MHTLHLSFLSKQDCDYVSNKDSHFQLVGPTRSSPTALEHREVVICHHHP
jgi:hypothetical protein